MSGIDKVNVFQELADVLPFGVAVLALDGTILYWNRAAERIRGYRSHEIVGRRCGSDPRAARCESDDSSCEADSCPHRSVLRDGQALNARVLASHRDGHRVPLRMQAFPMHDERDEVVAVAEIFAEQDSDGAANWIGGNRSNLHPALGIPAVSATEEQLKRQLLESSAKLGVFLFGVEGLDEAVKRYGTGIRVVALRALAQTLVCVLGATHFIGSWTADRFLVIVPECCEEIYTPTMDKLQRAGSACAVTWWGDRIKMKVHAAGTLADSEDSIATVMQRLEQAAPAQAAGGEQ